MKFSNKYSLAILITLSASFQVHAGLFDSIGDAIKGAVETTSQSPKDATESDGSTNTPALNISSSNQPGKQSNSSNDQKLEMARLMYYTHYPDAKPVEYIGESGQQHKEQYEKYKILMIGNNAQRFMEGGIQNLTFYYQDAKKDENKLVSDENYTYLFSFSNNNKTLSSMQIDSKNIENTKLLIKEKVGIMEPILYFDEYFKLKVDVENTKRIYSHLSKALSLKPVDITIKAGDILVKSIMDELNHRAKLSAEKTKIAITGKYKVTSIIDELNKIKEESTVETEYQTIYNVRFKKVFESEVFKDISYVVILNKDNMFVDRFPNFVTQKVFTEQYIRGRAPQVENTSGKDEVFRAYLFYKDSVEKSITALKKGTNYANTSIQLFSLDRLKSLENTGAKLIPELKVTTTNIPKLDDLLLDSTPSPYEEDATSQELQKCHSALTTIDKKCWTSMLSVYERLWDPLVNAQTRSQISKSRSTAMEQYGQAISHLMKSKDMLKMTGAISSSRLK